MCSFEPLLEVARRAVAHAVDTGRPLAIDPLRYPEPLQRRGASFVTLRRNGELRGCLGSLEPVRPLVVDAAANAFAAAARDPRFAPVAAWELDALRCQVSILGPPEPIDVASEDELLAQLRPDVDGLVIEEGPRRATFLPQVWAQLPDAREFVRQLKRKAGIPADHWSSAMRVARYSVETVGDAYP
jgi:hypothetical protein